MRVFVSSHYREYTGAGEVAAEGATVADALAHLDRQFPGMRFRLVDERGLLRRHVNIFVGTESTRDLSTPVPDGTDLHIIGALSGG